MGLSESLPSCLFAPCGSSLHSCANILLMLHTVCAITYVLCTNCICGALELNYEICNPEKKRKIVGILLVWLVF